MNLPVDARQRAMLLEMGVRVWHAPPLVRQTPAVLEKADSGSDASRSHPTPTAQAAPESNRPVAHAPQADPVNAEPAAPPRAHTQRVDAVTAPSDTNAAAGWKAAPLQLLYPDADPAQTPPDLGAGWLVVTDAFIPGEPSAQAAGQLFGAMLQALQLHQHPRVALCAIEPHPAEPGGPAAPAADAIAAHVVQFAPSVVLVMGRNAIRAALGSTEPLAKLRQQPLFIAGVPTVATFDAQLLLRNPAAKRTAWADLCRARALAGRGADTPVP